MGCSVNGKSIFLNSRQADPPSVSVTGLQCVGYAHGKDQVTAHKSCCLFRLRCERLSCRKFMFHFNSLQDNPGYTVQVDDLPFTLNRINTLLSTFTHYLWIWTRCIDRMLHLVAFLAVHLTEMGVLFQWYCGIYWWWIVTLFWEERSKRIKFNHVS